MESPLFDPEQFIVLCIFILIAFGFFFATVILLLVRLGRKPDCEIKFYHLHSERPHVPKKRKGWVTNLINFIMGVKSK
jgi:hypothetical protein